MPAAISRKQATHERIVSKAAQAIRRGGYQGVAVADIMRSAGLTHGGFYAHFPNRDGLLIEAVEHAGDQSVQVLTSAIAKRVSAGKSRFEALISVYLSERHVQNIENGCPIAALLSDLPRQSEAVQIVSKHRVAAYIELVRSCLPIGSKPELAEDIASAMVGALQLARAMPSQARASAFLAARRQHLTERYS